MIIRILNIIALLTLVTFSLVTIAQPVAPLKIVQSNKHPLFTNAPLYIESVLSVDEYANGLLSDIVQDKHGFIWLASQRGLARYDGQKLKQYRENIDDPSSILSNIATQLYIDKFDNIWISTNLGLAFFNPETEQFTNFEFGNKTSGLIGTHASSFAQTQLSGVWIGTNNGLIFYSFEHNKFIKTAFHSTLPDELASGTIYDLKIMNDGSLLIASINGLWQLPSGNKTFEKLSDWTVSQIFESAQGDIWFGLTDGSLARKMKDSSTLTLENIDYKQHSINKGSISSIVEPVAGELWIAYQFLGIDVIDEATLTIKHKLTSHLNVPGTLAINDIRAMLVDSHQHLWIVTNGSGLQRYNGANQSFATLRSITTDPTSLSNPRIYAITQTLNKQIWLGHNKGIDVLSPTGKRLETITPKITNNNQPFKGTLSVSAISEEINGIVWVGSSSDGLFKVDVKSKKTLAHYSLDHGLRNKKIRHVIANQDGTLWLGTFEGIQHFDPGTETFSDVNLLNGQLEATLAQPTAHLVRKNKDIVFSLVNSSYILIPHDGEALDAYYFPITISVSENQPDRLITTRALEETEQGELWLAANEGVFKVTDLTEELTSHNWHRKPNNQSEETALTNLLVDKQGRLWESALMYDPATQSLHELAAIDGVDVGNDWIASSYKTSDGVFIFGATTGLLMIWPEFYQQNDYQAEVKITDIFINGKKKLLGQQEAVLLNENERNLMVEFISLDYSMPSKNNYRYKLVGEDNDWTEVGGDVRRASYNNLPTGEYQLEIQASDRYGQWNAQTLTLPILVTPKYYQRGWFQVLAFLLAIVFIQRLHRWQMRRVIKKTRKIITRKLAAQRLANIEIQLTEKEQAQRTLALSNKALADEKQKAVLATKAKSRFLANMSHEIRTPINAVLGMSYLTLKTSLSQQQKHYVENIQTSAEGLLGVISDVLTLSKIEAGASELIQESFSIDELIINSVDVLNALAQQKGLVIEYELDKNTPDFVIADKGKLKQILINLLGNAIKFTSQGSVKLICHHTKVNKKHQINFAVQDTGIGIAKENLAKVCDAFTQIDDSRTRDFEGTGLGLKISHQLISLMGGKLALSSELDVGSCFSFTLALDAGEQPHEQSYDQVKSSTDDKKIHNAHILIADDEEINRLLLKSLLELVGLTVIEAEDGLSAVELCQKFHFDLILLDIHMPKLDGYQATKKIRAIQNYQTTPIIAITANAFDTDRAEALSVGMTEHMVKPIKPDLLYQRLGQWCHIEQLAPEKPKAKVKKKSTGDNQFIVQPNHIQRYYYQQMLNAFIEDHQTDMTLLQSAIDNKDLELLQKLVHALEGCTGNIGAEPLYKEIIKFKEQYNTSMPEGVPAELDKLFTQTVSEIKAIVVQTKKEPTLLTAISIQELLTAISDLMGILQANSFDFQTQLTIVTTHLPAQYQDKALELKSLLKEFEFELAFEICQQLKQNIKSSELML